MQAAKTVLVEALRLKVMLGLVPLAPEVAQVSRNPSPFLAGLVVSISAPKVALPPAVEALNVTPAVLPSRLPQAPKTNSLAAVVVALTAVARVATAVPVAVPVRSRVGVPVKPLTSAMSMTKRVLTEICICGPVVLSPTPATRYQISVWHVVPLE